MFAAMMNINSVHAQSIPYQDIWANPDDKELNLKYARQAIASGELQDAASALERLLLTSPNWDSVRVLYGIVLYRLDDKRGALEEFRKLEGRDLNARDEGLRQEYLARLEHENAAIRISGAFTLGGRYDENPGLVSNSISDGTIFLSTPAANDDEDYGVLGSATLRIEGNIDNIPGSVWFVALDGRFDSFQDVSRSNRMYGSLKGGAIFVGGRGKLAPYAIVDQYWLQSDRFLSRWGGGVKASYDISEYLSLHAGGEYLTENFSQTSTSPENDQRDGSKTTGTLGLKWRATESQTFFVDGFMIRKSADNEGFAYDEDGIAIRSFTLLGNGAYLKLDWRYSDVNYKEPDGVVFVDQPRQDIRQYSRAALGFELLSLFPESSSTPEIFEDVLTEVGIAWTDQNSNLPNLEYDNFSVDVSFTKRFSF